MKNFLLYGSYGYTGQLIAEEELCPIFVGKVADPNGGRVASKLTTPEGYTCTALTTVEIIQRILNGETKTGFQTPSLAYSKDLILQFDGVKREDLL